MAISKIIFNGVTNMDLTQDSVAAATLLSGETAHGADGLPVTGAYVPSGGGGGATVFMIPQQSITTAWDDPYYSCIIEINPLPAEVVPDTIDVVFGGVTYTDVPLHATLEDDGYVEYGAGWDDNIGNYDFSVYPFSIGPSYEGSDDSVFTVAYISTGSARTVTISASYFTTSIYITQNGTYDVTDYSEVIVKLK